MGQTHRQTDERTDGQITAMNSAPLGPYRRQWDIIITVREVRCR